MDDWEKSGGRAHSWNRIQSSARLSAIAVVGFLLVSTATVSISCADELRPTLPENGTWVRYQVDTERLGVFKRSRQFLLSVVGRELQNEEACLWLELKKTGKFVADGDEETHIWKLLVREKDLLENDKPLENVIRVWHRFNANPPELCLPEHFRVGFDESFMWTPGVVKNAKTIVDAKEVDYQKGRLKIENSLAGSIGHVQRNSFGDITMTWTLDFRTWLHTDIPVGSAAAEITYKAFDGDMNIVATSISKFLLQDAGTGAKTALPECN